MRNRFEQQLDKLRESLVEMGKSCESAISKAMEAVETGDQAVAREAMAIDHQIDQMERDIEGMCLKLLLRQQPVARDLRAISSALKMISDMERVGDQATDIAEIAQFIQRQHRQSRKMVHSMAAAAIQMVHESVDSFVRGDEALARHVIDSDDVVDTMFARVKEELIACIGADGAGGEYYLDILMIAKYLERIGDHATNIAEWVLFSITGRHEG